MNDLNEKDKFILKIMFKMFVIILSSMAYLPLTNGVTIDQNDLFELAEKLNIDIYDS